MHIHEGHVRNREASGEYASKTLAVALSVNQGKGNRHEGIDTKRPRKPRLPRSLNVEIPAPTNSASSGHPEKSSVSAAPAALAFPFFSSRRSALGRLAMCGQSPGPSKHELSIRTFVHPAAIQQGQPKTTGSFEVKQSRPYAVSDTSRSS